ncbi:CPBP family intramembrane glutamic endopeptidase [Dysgonomonas sp. 520]|uniref:CPBP family intramembrane glutamic endopeptidase n=1 Tax=Dysgonomonas sp. 520 TaxID=2302931 RepID=UPI0013D73EBE|nr:type II CAAX endopeptidase family protein [Dysgonomonas sp. 520]NDW08161.1 CPBP family intramembrane metalloprotease [Dysgonomonas sp. 520]
MISKIKHAYGDMSSWMQLVLLVLFTLAGTFVSILVLMLVLSLMGVDIHNPSAIVSSALLMRVNQFVQTTFMFFIPALLWGYLFNKKTSEGLKINKAPALSFVLVGIALIIIVQPLINLTAYYNDRLVLPEFLSSLEVKLRTMEESNAFLMQKLLSENSTYNIIANIFIIAIVAGIYEEFFFRGALQQIFKKIIGNYHVTVWVMAVIFSAVHMQFFGFVPRVILGAILGYLFVWSGNLWVPIIVHVFNNAWAVIMSYVYGIEVMSVTSQTLGVGDTLWASAISLILTFIVMFYLAKKYLRKSIESGEI